ncbi:MAG: RpiB/LacA/LacB family sugar-phosphate isomerase [Nanoarchaeota archaeon]|nr:RpiB/LacA/LacB family sugar-phosphate isomerase [Nanoarchaeota archaeon]MBU0976842.1 RpiB/LacA/LacB family sugar-phosphate isomerase [Nanoarchaeota archaeon]
MKKELPPILLASDHAGFKLKEKIKDHLILNGHAIFDCGPFKLNPEDDYPDFILPCAKKVAKTKNSLGIILGGSGQGEAIAANKIKGIRAAAIYSFNKKMIQLTKQHNNANILSLGARFLTEKQALQAVDLWLKTRFSNQARHKRRIKKIEQ